jgi:hypothetical protein
VILLQLPGNNVPRYSKAMVLPMIAIHHTAGYGLASFTTFRLKKFNRKTTIHNSTCHEDGRELDKILWSIICFASLTACSEFTVARFLYHLLS